MKRFIVTFCASAALMGIGANVSASSGNRGGVTADLAELKTDATHDTIALVKGKFILFEKVRSSYEELDFLSNTNVRRIGAYLLELDTKKYPVEDWIKTLEKEYNGYAAQQNMAKVEPSLKGVRALVELTSKIEDEGEPMNMFQLSSWSSVGIDQQNFLGLYSMNCLKVLLHTNPAAYNAMTSMDKAFNNWKEAQRVLFINVMDCNGNASGSISSLYLSTYLKWLYSIRPMTSFYIALCDSDCELPAPTSIDMKKAIFNEYDLMIREIGSAKDYRTKEPIDLKSLVRKAKEAYGVYAEKADSFVKCLPHEKQEMLSRIIAGKNRQILINLKNRMLEFQESDMVEEDVFLLENADDNQIINFNNSDNDYWKCEFD